MMFIVQIYIDGGWLPLDKHRDHKPAFKQARDLRGQQGYRARVRIERAQ